MFGWRAVVVVILTAATATTTAARATSAPATTTAAVECGKPPALENGSPRDEYLPQDTFPVGANVSYRCNRGYTLKQGISPVITCKADSTWSPLVVTCELKSCGSPGDILNGHYNATGNKFGSTVTFYCNRGYKLVGRSTRRCEHDGWTGQVPTCEVVKCPDPAAIRNGTVSGLGNSEFWEYGMTAVYSCLPGHTLTGPAEVSCTAEGRWSATPPSCKAVECGKPPALENGSPRDEYLSNDTFPVGAKVIYRCNRGYTLQQGISPVITCKADSTWSPLVVTCELKSCGSPGDIQNGHYTATGNKFGSTVTFYCNTGYKLVGRSTRRCEHDGWTGQVPTCEVVTCPDPAAISNGTVSGLGNSEFWEYGMTALYSCLPGHTLTGPAEVICTAEGRWSATPPSCKAVECGKPPALENGSPRDEYLSNDTFPVGAKVIYRCNRGYTLQQGISPVITCKADSTWSPLVVTCELKSCGSPGDIQNGHYTATGNKFGSTVTFYCNTGYKLVGRSTRRCEHDGWTGQVPTCEVVTCPDPAAISNGTVSGLGNSEFWEYGMTALYSCLPGHTLTGPAEVICTAEGRWSATPPSCKAVECGKPPALENGSPRDEYLSNDTFPVGAKVIYRCNRGYTLQQGISPVITCKADSTWSPLVVTCELKSCGSPGDIQNGHYTATGNKFGSTVTFYCNTGYKLVGRSTRRCEHDGWTGQVPTCEVVTCPDPAAISNGTVSGLGNSEFWEYGMTALYSCLPGHTLTGPAEVICTAEGRWSATPPSCKGLDKVVTSSPTGNNHGTSSHTTHKGGSVGTSVGQQHILLLLLTAILIFCLQL
ncbi:sushi, von Willebrand factor type A, EGF and pentraxin domain-containing protein 1-like [Rhinoraja longicauda]